MYQLVRGKPLKDIEFNIIRSTKGKYRNRLVCDDIFTFDTETTSDYVDEQGNVFMFDYDNPERAHNSLKHSVCYLWQFGINENRYIGRELSDFTDLLFELNQYISHNIIKFVFVHNLAFDFCFLQNVIKFDNVFARTPRHPMSATSRFYGIEFRCSYVLTNLRLETWADANKLKAQKKTGLLDYRVLRTPLTPLTQDELDYAIADLDVIYEGIKVYRKQYGAVWSIPLTHTGKVRRLCAEVMSVEPYYCKNVTALTPPNLNEYVKQAHAFIGGTVFCNWLYKRRTLKNVTQYDIVSSYPWALINNLYPQSRLLKVPKSKYDRYLNNPDYVYIIKFTAYGVESNYNCHFISKAKAISISHAVTDNGRVVSCDSISLILTSVDYHIFERCYTCKSIEIDELKISRCGYLSNTFRRFVIETYKDKTTLKNVPDKETLYQNKKENLNALYGDMVTKQFSDQIDYDYSDKENIWHKTILDDDIYAKKLGEVYRRQYKNYKVFLQGIFVTAWARSRIWSAVLDEQDGERMDEHIVYTDTDSLKMYHYNGDFFERDNKVVLTRHEEIARELGIDVNDLSPVDIKGNAHPIGVWEQEETAVKFRSLGCKQYMCEYADGHKKLTCAGISKLAVKCFKDIDAFDIDRTLTEKELVNAKDDKGHTAEKLTPYYNVEYPEVHYPDGYVCKYKSGVCLMPTTFNLSITPNDLALLYGIVADKLNKSYYREDIRK